ncbi:MLP-like protein [Canna indica]|uniref:MLP-like protein n=1 Tax=Canna indica TaxID=4628 RepID=A0AAQ3QK81_9LILI|nr:MLP-like protein [Canna indica]
MASNYCNSAVAVLEMEAKSSPAKFWEALLDSTNLFPKLFPDRYKSIEIIHGDGLRAGTVRLIKYGEGMPMITFAEQEIEVVNHVERLMSYSIMDGEMMSFFKRYKGSLKVEAKDDGGSLVRYCAEVDKVSEEVPDPDAIMEVLDKCFKELDVYLMNNKD